MPVNLDKMMHCKDRHIVSVLVCFRVDEPERALILNHDHTVPRQYYCVCVMSALVT